MHDTAPGRHQVHITRADDHFGAEAVAVLDLAVEEIGNGRKTDMWMRADVDRLARTQQRRSHPVEENEWADEAASRRGQRASDLQPADIAGTRNDQMLDSVAGGLVSRKRIGTRKEGHGRGSGWWHSPKTTVSVSGTVAAIGRRSVS